MVKIGLDSTPIFTNMDNSGDSHWIISKIGKSSSTAVEVPVDFGTLVVPVPDSHNLSIFRYSVPVLLQPEYRGRYRYRQYRSISVPDTGF